MAGPRDHAPTEAEQALGSWLVQDGAISPAQLLAAQGYGRDHKLDLRQALLKLRLVDDAKIRSALAAPRPAASNRQAGVLVAAEPAPPPAEPAEGKAAGLIPVASDPLAPRPDQIPDLARRERDIRAELKVIAASAASPDLVAQIFERAFETRATDIHFDPQDSFLRIRYRIDGQLHDVLELDPALATSLISRLKVMADLNIVERRHAQDGRIQFRHGEQIRDLRMATIPTVLGEKVVVRVHETMTQEYGFDLLGLNAAQTEALTKLCAKPYGAVLVAGPVGAGKTTTLYTCLSRVNTPARNVMTIEDPIERRMLGINQVQVDSRIDMTFGSGLKAMLRQDPDVVMIGEIRDEETAHIGIRAALTGVLVFSTIHAADAPSTLGNLYDFKIPGYMLSNTLLAVISQRLLRKICPHCKVTYPAEEEQLALLDLDPNDHPSVLLARGEGCPACFNTGYLGRSGIFEIMEINDTLRELIFQQISKDVLQRVAVDLGMRTLKQAAVDKVLQGATPLEEVFRVVPM